MVVVRHVRGWRLPGPGRNSGEGHYSGNRMRKGYHVTKQLRDNVFELFHGPEKDIPETPLDVARPVAASPPVAAAGSAVDLTGKPKIIMLMGAGRSGKSSLARLIVERALNREDPPE